MTAISKSAASLSDSAALALDPRSGDFARFHLFDIEKLYHRFAYYLKQGLYTGEFEDRLKARVSEMTAFMQTHRSEGPAPPDAVSLLPIRYRDWRIDLATIVLDEQPYASGTAALCYRGTERATGRAVAIKKMRRVSNGIEVDSYRREVEILISADHPSIVTFLGATSCDPYCMILEWMPGGSLSDELYRDNRLNATQLTKVAFDVARGMRFLHSRRIIHRDLKSPNVLLDADGHAKICDFGYARHDPGEFLMTKHLGTEYWIAPELVLAVASYDESVDVYSYGILLNEICSRELPYRDIPDFLRAVVAGDLRPTIPPTVPDGFAVLQQRCWAAKAADRPPFVSIIREFAGGRVFLRGADRAELGRYVAAALEEDQARDLGLAPGGRPPPAGAIAGLVEKFAVEGVPDKLCRRFWERLAEWQGHAPPAVIGRGLSLLFASAASLEAVALFRELPRDPDLAPFIADTIRRLPTDDPAFDREAVLAACWHGAPDLCMLCVDAHPLSDLAIEIVAQEGAEPGLKTAVADRCVQLLMGSYLPGFCGALRCLVGIGETRRVPMNALEKSIRGDLTELRDCALVILAQRIEDGAIIRRELLDAVIEMAATEEVAVIALVAACRDPALASIVIEKADRLPGEARLRVLLACMKNEDLFEQLRRLIEGLRGEDEGLANALLAKIGAQKGESSTV
jgi:serine/threonine protein kinase